MNNKLITDVFFVGMVVACTSCNFASAAQAQTALQFDVDLAKRFRHIDTMKHQAEKSDEIEKLNDQIRQLLIKTGTRKFLMNAPLKRSIAAGLWLTQSPDRKVRIYSWDRNSTGTAHSYESVVQYKTGTKFQALTFVLDKHACNQSYYEQLKQYSLRHGETVYVAIGTGFESTDIIAESVSAFKTSGGGLRQVDFFKTPKRSLSTISVEARMDSDATYAAIEFINQNTIMRVPLIDKELNNTYDFLIYKFDGKKFVYIGTKKG